MALVLEAGKWYITEGDYLVFTEKLSNGSICSSIETSPGTTAGGLVIKQLLDGHGWCYKPDGKMADLDGDWNQKLSIVAEYPKQLSLPEGYEWFGGYPKLYSAKDVIGRYVIRDDGTVIKSDVLTNFFNSPALGTKRIGLMKQETAYVPEYTVSPKPKLELAVGKWYLTAGDYLVFLKEEFKDGWHNGICASIETSPGVNIHGNSITQSNLKHGRASHIGWVYRTYNHGEITGLSPEWNEKLRIVKEYTYPVVLPDGFEWKGGYPKLYTAEELGDCHFLRWDAKKALLYTDFSDFPDDGFGAKRIGLVKKEATPMPNIQLTVGKWYVTAGDYLVNITGEKNGYFVSSLETSPGVDIYGKFAKDIVPKGDGWYYKSNCEVFSNLDEKWVNDLKIVAEYPHPINVSDRFEWKGGFPKLYDAEDILHDWCILADGDVVENNSRSPFDDVAVIGIKRVGLLKKKKEEIAPVSTPKLKLAAGKWYITAGGYVVNIKKIHADGLAHTATATSPGASPGGCWGYNLDGSISSLSQKWADKLPIVAEYPYPVKLPEGFKWKEGYPKLYELSELDDSDRFLTVSDVAATLGVDVYKGVIFENKCFDKIGTVGEKRIGLVCVDKKEEEKVVTQPEFKLAVGKWYVTKGDYLVNIVSQSGTGFNASFETSPGCLSNGTTIRHIFPVDKGWGYDGDTKRISCLKQEWIDALEIVAEYPYPVNLPDGYEWRGGFPKLYEAKELASEEYYLQLSGKISKNKYPTVPFVKFDHFARKRVGFVKVDEPVESPVPVPIVESKEEMKKETAIKIAGVAGSLGFRALNYWLFEPAVNTFRPVVKGVRYAVFLGTLASAVYGYRHPDVVKNAIMSCLPKISVEAPEILK